MAASRTLPRIVDDARRQPRAEATRTLVLHTADTLFRQHGYDHTSVESICEHAFLSRGAFYYHFASKDDVLIALAMRDGPELQHAFETLIGSEAPSADVLAATVRLFARGMAAMTRIELRAVVQEMVRSWTADPPMAPGLRENLDVLITRAAERGELRPDADRGDLAATLFGAMFATLLEWLSGPAEVAAAELERRLLRRTQALWAVNADRA